MAEEFQAGICGETWWNINSTRSHVFPLMSSTSSCSVAANDAGSYSNTWQTAGRPCIDYEQTNNINNFVSDNNGSLPFLDAHQKPQQSESTAAGSFLIDSTLQNMGFGLSSPTSSNWSHSLFGSPASNFHSVLEEETGTDSYNHSQIQKDWSTRNFSSASETTVDAFNKPIEQEFCLDQQSMNNNSVSSSITGLSSCEFPTSYGYPLYEPDPQPQPQNSSLLFTNPSMSTMPYLNSSSASYGNEVSPTWSKVSSSLMIKPSMPKQQLSGLHFSNNTPFWNEAVNDIRAGSLLASPQPQYQSTNFEEKKTNSPITTTVNKLKREECPDKKNTSEPAMKRTRIETPSPLPTFKVRKEKLGDRITALQQLVSPFGKTDTASVLHEAIEYIKFLHDQVNVLGTPYMKNGASLQNPQGSCDNVKESKEPKQDLRSQGLCLVPISSTFPLTNETTVDFWTPTFGGPLFGM